MLEEEKLWDEVTEQDEGVLTTAKKVFMKCIGKDKPVVAVLRLSGVIGHLGAFKKGLTLEDLEETIERAFTLSPSSLKAVAIEVNSPGGSPVQSELIYKRIRTWAKEKNLPVITFVEDAAASGGYWLACAGDEIFVSESSIVGSIGVISSGFGFTEAIRKMGIERRIHTQGENKSILDPFKPEREEDIAIIMNVQKDIHDAFKNLVRDRRKDKINLEQEHKLFSGEFWSGKQAVDLGLADGIGDLRSIMRERYGEKVQMIKIAAAQSWFKKKFGMMSAGLAESFVSSANRMLTEKGWWGRLGL